MTQYDEHPLDLQWDAIAAELGAVMIEWSRIEFLVSMVFLHVSEVPAHAGAVLIRKLRGEGLDDVTRRLLSALSDSDAQSVRTWLEGVRKLREQRNTLFHGHMVNQANEVEWVPSNLRWTYDPETSSASLSGAALSTTHLSSLQDAIRESISDFKNLPAAVRGWIATE